MGYLDRRNSLKMKRRKGQAKKKARAKRALAAKKAVAPATKRTKKSAAAAG